MITTPLLLEVEVLRNKWGWLLSLGIAMVILGVIALAVVPVATLAAVIVLGWVMIVSGIIEAIHAFQVRGWGGVFLHLIGAIVGVLVGLLVITHPLAGALGWTLLFAAFLTVIGIFRTVAAISLKFPNWGWAVLDGLVTLALGILVWASWPWSGLWFLGISAGVSLLLRGWSYVMFSLAIRHLPTAARNIRQAA